MAGHVCPPFIGYWLLNPFRKLLENPRKMLPMLLRDSKRMVCLAVGEDGAVR